MSDTHPLLLRTRRHFFRDCAVGLGGLALTDLMQDGRLLAAPPAEFANPFAARRSHFAPKAKAVIYMFMAGAPSQLELFDYKPKLQELNGKPIPDEYIKNKRFAF